MVKCSTERPGRTLQFIAKDNYRSYLKQMEMQRNTNFMIKAYNIVVFSLEWI